MAFKCLCVSLECKFVLLMLTDDKTCSQRCTKLLQQGLSIWGTQARNTSFIPIQGLHPSKDPAFVAFEGESFGEMFEGRLNCCWMGRSSLQSISCLCHQKFLHLLLRQDFCRPGPWKLIYNLRNAMSTFSLFLSSFSGTQRTLGYGRPQRIVTVHPPKRWKRRPHLWGAIGRACELAQPSHSVVASKDAALNWDTATNKMCPSPQRQFCPSNLNHTAGNYFKLHLDKQIRTLTINGEWKTVKSVSSSPEIWNHHSYSHSSPIILPLNWINASINCWHSHLFNKENEQGHHLTVSAVKWSASTWMCVCCVTIEHFVQIIQVLCNIHYEC